jgi:hypothetical protein
MQVKQQAAGVDSKAPGRLLDQQQQQQQPNWRRRSPSSSSSSSSKMGARVAAAAAALSNSEDEEAEDGADSPTAGSLVASKQELRASHVLRALNAWLDEV